MSIFYLSVPSRRATGAIRQTGSKYGSVDVTKYMVSTGALADSFSFQPGLDFFSGEGSGFNLFLRCGGRGFNLVADFAVDLDCELEFIALEGFRPSGIGPS